MSLSERLARWGMLARGAQCGAAWLGRYWRRCGERMRWRVPTATPSLYATSRAHSCGYLSYREGCTPVPLTPAQRYLNLFRTIVLTNLDRSLFVAHVNVLPMSMCCPCQCCPCEYVAHVATTQVPTPHQCGGHCARLPPSFCLSELTPPVRYSTLLARSLAPFLYVAAQCHSATGFDTHPQPQSQPEPQLRPQLAS